MMLLTCAAALMLAGKPAEKAPAPAPAAPAEKPITFGISQPYGAEQAAKAKTLIEPYLSKQLNATVTVQVFPSYEELSEALSGSKVDLAWITPLAFVQASDKNADVTALSKAMRSGGGGLYYRSAFIVKKGAPYTALAQLKGKKVAWVGKSSASGYLVAREMVKKLGENPDKFFAEEVMAGDHPGVCKAVKDGKADVGATFAQDPGEGKTAQADGCGAQAGDYTVVASVGPVPNEVIAVRPDFTFDRKRVNRVVQTFGRMSMSDDGKKLLKDAFQVDGWGIAVDGDFDPIIDLLHPRKKAKVVDPNAGQ
jgi:phosphonate transport system substrate-binding protein